MKIIVDIPDDYKEKDFTDTICKAIATGIVLQKGHGCLIDASMLMQYCQNQRSKTVDCNDIARFPIVIPADKEETND